MKGVSKLKEENYEELKIQLEEYKQEKERIRKIVGQIGGKKDSRYHKISNQIFLILVLLVFIIGLIFNSIPTSLAVLLGIFFISVKTLWMIHDQQKINHFQFWVLSTIEFKLNELEKKINKK